MISFDTFFTTIITLAVFYGTILVTLIIAKKNKPSLHIKCYIIILTVVCVLFASIAFALCFGHIPFWFEILVVAQSILSAFDETSFAFENFYIIYICGIIGFSPIGALCSYRAISEFDEEDIIIVEADINMLAAILIPYLTGTFIYIHLYSISFLLAALASFFFNFLISYILVGIFLIMDMVDSIVTCY